MSVTSTQGTEKSLTCRRTRLQEAEGSNRVRGRFFHRIKDQAMPTASRFASCNPDDFHPRLMHNRENRHDRISSTSMKQMLGGTKNLPVP